MSTNQSTVGPPPGFSNHLPSGLSSNRMVYEDDQQTLNMLLQQHRLQQQQLQQSQQQQLIRQLSAEDATVSAGGYNGYHGSSNNGFNIRLLFVVIFGLQPFSVGIDLDHGEQ
uniref:Uncharacterized protein n=1 Tax=Anopheles epiroticus TaxID=199890 RepID=A0A182PMN9_9DIPT